MKIILALLMISTSAFAKEKVVYKYKEYEKFDLGDMEIKGSIVAPGDLSVKERRRKIFHRKLYNKENFDKLIIQEIKYMR
jgi:hypothetical protein